MSTLPFLARIRRTLLTIMVAACGLPWTAPALAQSEWQRCAGQDEICRFNGEALVRYGTDGQYNYKVLRNRVICDQQEFGDPIFGRSKQCDFNFDLRQPRSGGPAGPQGNEWVPCAGEGETCRFNGDARVRYGADNRYAYRNATGQIRCGAELFGDPIFGVRKQCEYQAVRGAGGNPAQNAGWDFCASEGAVCAFSGNGEVRYGVNGKFIVKRAINGMPCTVEAFGRDPAYGQDKVCYVRAVGR